MAPMTFFTQLDFIAITWFVVSVSAYSWFAEHGPLQHRSLSAHMNKQREAWLRVALQRELRIVDTTIVTGLQNGTAFFASASLLGIGACFGLLRSTNEIFSIMEDLSISPSDTRIEWEVKVFTLLLLFSYAFFKFGWSHRLWNYTSILVGALPMFNDPDEEKAEAALQSALAMNILAGKHFNRGLRTFFLSTCIIGWFIGPVVFMITTTWIILVLMRRQFFSASAKAAEMNPIAKKDPSVK
ncbi:MAG: DUF599 family protein [Hyphomicrobiales bacterium]